MPVGDSINVSFYPKNGITNYYRSPSLQQEFGKEQVSVTGSEIVEQHLWHLAGIF